MNLIRPWIHLWDSKTLPRWNKATLDASCKFGDVHSYNQWLMSASVHAQVRTPCIPTYFQWERVQTHISGYSLHNHWIQTKYWPARSQNFSTNYIEEKSLFSQKVEIVMNTVCEFSPNPHHRGYLQCTSWALVSLVYSALQVRRALNMMWTRWVEGERLAGNSFHKHFAFST